MHRRQVIIISGKTCTGKTTLAQMLKERFGFSVLQSRDVISNSETAAEASILDDAQLARIGSHLSKIKGENWLLQPAIQRLESNGRFLVVDQVTSEAQVKAFRAKFDLRLIHVHLYASVESLSSRHSVLAGKDASYDDIDHLKDSSDLEYLKQDADVRIYTSRSDPEDTLVRVAANLNLYSPPTERCVDVVIGGQYGSEGKGNVSAYLAREYDYIVRVGGPNAGHTVLGPTGEPYTHHHLPSGARDVNAKLLLGPGMTIRVEKLLKEVKECGIGSDRLFIDPQATIITDEHVNTEKNRLVGEIGSTGSGSGAAAAHRILERGGAVTLAKDIPELADFVGTESDYHGRTLDRLEEAYSNRASILLEGTQGSGLSIYHGKYPFVTSRDTNVAGCLAEAGISPSRVRRILMVIRTTPIRVGDPEGEGDHTSGPLKHETSFEEVANRSNGLKGKDLITAEKTSTTKRNRRVGWFDWQLFRTACALNAPTDIVLTFTDYLSASNREARRFEQLHEDTIKFIEEVERVAHAPVSMISTRFHADEQHPDIRSLIDRRNWTGLSTR